MAQAGQCSGFGFEVLTRRGISSHGSAQDFDRDVAAQPVVSRAVDLTHPSRVERRQDLIGTQVRATCQQAAGSRWHRFQPGWRRRGRLRDCGALLDAGPEQAFRTQTLGYACQGEIGSTLHALPWRPHARHRALLFCSTS
jgi:hypothetical protein